MSKIGILIGILFIVLVILGIIFKNRDRNYKHYYIDLNSNTIKSFTSKYKNVNIINEEKNIDMEDKNMDSEYFKFYNDNKLKEIRLSKVYAEDTDGNLVIIEPETYLYIIKETNKTYSDDTVYFKNSKLLIDGNIKEINIVKGEADRLKEAMKDVVKYNIEKFKRFLDII